MILTYFFVFPLELFIKIFIGIGYMFLILTDDLVGGFAKEIV